MHNNELIHNKGENKETDKEQGVEAIETKGDLHHYIQDLKENLKDVTTQIDKATQERIEEGVRELQGSKEDTTSLIASLEKYKETISKELTAMEQAMEEILERESFYKEQEKTERLQDLQMKNGQQKEDIEDMSIYEKSENEDEKKYFRQMMSRSVLGVKTLEIEAKNKIIDAKKDLDQEISEKFEKLKEQKIKDLQDTIANK